jgi:hypothetical protein
MLAVIEIIITGVVAGVAGFIAGAAAVALGNKRAVAGPAKAEPKLFNATLEDTSKGGLLHLVNLGDDAETLDVEVERHDRYVAGREEWHQLETTYRNRLIAIEWQKARGVLRAWAHRKLRALSLADVGLTEETLAALKPGQTLAHGGATYTVDVAGKALRHENGTGFGKEHDAWRLVTPDAQRVLHIERWSGKPVTASVGEAIDPAVVEVHRARA